MKIPLLVLLALLSSCSTKYYTLPQSGPTATVSFSNLSEELPEIVLIENCAVSKVNNIYFENKLPNERSKNRLMIAIDKTITLEYTYSWFSGMIEDITTSGTKLKEFIKVERRKAVKTCKESVTFIPEENKHYEVYFGIVNEKCIIKASEAHFSDEGKWISSINIIDKPKC